MSSSSSESIKSDAPVRPQTVLPATSRETYNRAYESFISWKNEVGINNFSEDVFMTYFESLAKKKQPSTLYSTYSMLKATMNANNEINIDNYTKLTAYLKQISKGFKSKKTKVFTSKDVETFLKEAPDKFYLCLKVVLILGVKGSCRAIELINISLNDIERHSDQLLLIKLEDYQNKSDRSFILRGLHKEILERYLALRPPDMPSNRILIRYANGRCFKQVMGRNKISGIPALIAEYLNLPNSKLYTGHCFRRTGIMLTKGDPCYPRRSLRSGLREVYLEESMEMESTKDDEIEDKLNEDNFKVEFSPLSFTSETFEPTEKYETSTEKNETKSEIPSFQKKNEENVTHDIGSAKVTITQNTNEAKTISIPSKNITIIFENCDNVSNININF